MKKKNKNKVMIKETGDNYFTNFPPRQSLPGTKALPAAKTLPGTLTINIQGYITSLEMNNTFRKKERDHNNNIMKKNFEESGEKILNKNLIHLIYPKSALHWIQGYPLLRIFEYFEFISSLNPSFN